MTKKELRQRLSDIIDKKQNAYETFQGHELSAQGRDVKYGIGIELVTFNAALDALNDNNVMLNCY